MKNQTLLLSAAALFASIVTTAAEAPQPTLLWQLISRDNVNELRSVCIERCNFDFHDDASGKTPLLSAIENYHLFLISYVLAHGADPNLPDAWGEPPIIYTIRHEDSRPLTRLLSGGANPNAISRDGVPALILATQQQKTVHVAELLAAGAKPNLRDEEGRTALMHALEVRSPALVQVLLDAGAKTDVVNRNGVSAQQLAASTGMAGVLNQSTAAGTQR